MTTATQSRLAEVLDAHGGIDRWHQFSKVRSLVVSGGFLWGMKGIPLDDTPRAITSEFRRQWTRVEPFGQADWHMLYEPTRVVIETQAGEVVAQQDNPRETFTRAEGMVSFCSLKHIDAGVLNVGYAEDGPADGPAVILLHGWPYDIYTHADVAPVLASAGYRVIIPYLRGYGTTRFLSTDTPRNGQQAALAVDVIALMDALEIDKPIVAGCDWGARTTDIVAAAWPDRCKALVSVSGYLIGSREANRKPLPPQAELQWWYQFYFATERGRAGYEAHRREFARLIWQIASPKWKFDDATFDRTAASLENPDHVRIVVHNYRWRLGLAEGEPAYDSLENRLTGSPVISVPTITLEGDANGAHPAPAGYAAKFSGKYLHRNLTGGIGHNLPQEAPKAFAAAVIDVDAL